MSEQAKDILDLLKKQDEPLALSGGIRNLLGVDLQIVDDVGRLRTTYPRDKTKAYVECSRWPGLPVLPAKLQSTTTWRAITVGSFNDGYIELVKPLVDLTELVKFWRDAVDSRKAVLRGLPNMKALRKQKQDGPEMYCVVPVNVAIVAYFRYEEVDHLLVPARPLRLSSSNLGYRALVPAGYLLCNQPIRRR